MSRWWGSPSVGAGPVLPRMITPVGQRSTHRAQRVQTSSSMTNTTWSSGSMPGSGVFTASATVSGDSMWMQFHGQMSTQPSHMMHSDWSMWMNCLGVTAFCSSSGETSCRTYSPGNEGRGGLASVLATRPPSGSLDHRSAEGRGPRHLGHRSRPAASLLEGDPQGSLGAQHDDVDPGDDDVSQRLERDDDASPPGGRLDGGVGPGVEDRPLGRDGDQDAVGAPEQLVVGPLQPLVGHHAVAHEQDAEHERGGDASLAPWQRPPRRPAAPDDEDHSRAYDEEEQGDEELETHREVEDLAEHGHAHEQDEEEAAEAEDEQRTQQLGPIAHGSSPSFQTS